MISKNTTRIVSVMAATGLALALSACGGGEDSSKSDSGSKGDKSQSSDDNGGKKVSNKPFGAACSDVPDDGKGSFDSMSEKPVATAAGENPELSTLVDAVGEADLGDTLNSSDDITVFAPANAAFDKLPKKDLKAVMSDKDKLTDILTYHVVGETVTPDQLGSDGPFKSLQGAKVNASGSDEDFTINDDAKVVCGNVQTSNATVYIIDSVLMPPEK